MEIKKNSYNQRFRQYLEAEDFAPITIESKIKSVKNFFAKTQKEDIQITKVDVLKYLEYLKNNTKQQNKCRSINLVAISDYFAFLFEEGEIDRNPCWNLKIRGTRKKVIHKLYTPEELEQLCDDYYNVFVRNCGTRKQYVCENLWQSILLSRERNAVMLSIFANQGVITTEISKIEIDDLDLIKAKIKIRGAINYNERILPLKATQIGLLMNYLQNIRPQLLDLRQDDSNKLFLVIPNNNQKFKNKDKLLTMYDINFVKEIHSIDRQFLNFRQVRTSVISNWLKEYGLRKTQYMAGHKQISSTERYIANNIDGLIDDISKLHPF
jgi:site-specific recombinase XerD